MHPATSRSGNGVADLLDTLEDGEAMAHKLEHLRHERHGFERAVSVHSREDLGRRPNLDSVARPQRPVSLRGHGPRMMGTAVGGVNKLIGQAFNSLKRRRRTADAHKHRQSFGRDT